MQKNSLMVHCHLTFKQELEIIEGSSISVEKKENDDELLELLSAKEASLFETEEGTKVIKYIRELSRHNGKGLVVFLLFRKAELHGEFTEAEGSLNGLLRIRGRDSSDGSAFFDWRKEYKDVELKDKSKEGIAKAIKTLEQDFHKEVYLTNILISEEGVKRLRRLLPVTKTKMDWERYAMHAKIPEKSSAAQ